VCVCVCVCVCVKIGVTITIAVFGGLIYGCVSMCVCVCGVTMTVAVLGGLTCRCRPTRTTPTVCLLSPIYCLLSLICCLQSPICCLLSAFCRLLSFGVMMTVAVLGGLTCRCVTVFGYCFWLLLLFLVTAFVPPCALSCLLFAFPCLFIVLKFLLGFSLFVYAHRYYSHASTCAHRHFCPIDENGYIVTSKHSVFKVCLYSLLLVTLHFQ
jgi:hypothetical protein